MADIAEEVIPEKEADSASVSSMFEIPDIGISDAMPTMPDVGLSEQSENNRGSFTEFSIPDLGFSSPTMPSMPDLGMSETTPQEEDNGAPESRGSFTEISMPEIPDLGMSSMAMPTMPDMGMSESPSSANDAGGVGSQSSFIENMSMPEIPDLGMSSMAMPTMPDMGMSETTPEPTNQEGSSRSFPQMPDLGMSSMAMPTMPDMGMSETTPEPNNQEGDAASHSSFIENMSMPEIPDLGMSSMAMPEIPDMGMSETTPDDERGGSMSRMFAAMSMPDMPDMGMSETNVEDDRGGSMSRMLASMSMPDMPDMGMSETSTTIPDSVTEAEQAVEANLGELMHMGGDMLDAAMAATHITEETKDPVVEDPNSDASSSFLTKDQKDAVVDRYRLMIKKLNVQALNKSQFISLVKAILASDSTAAAPSRADLEAAFKVADEDKNGVIDENEFVNLFGLIKNGNVKGMAGGILKNFGLKSNKAKAKKQQLKKKFAEEKTVGASTV